MRNSHIFPLDRLSAVSFCAVAFVLLAGRAVADTGAFIYSSGSYSAFTVPGASDPAPFGINNRGQVVGTDGNENIGFLYQNGNSTLIAPGNNFSTRPVGINDSGLIVGNEMYPGSQGFRVFLDNSGSLTTLSLPASALATGINNTGEVVGWFDNSVFTAEAFLYANGAYSLFSAPGATSTYFYGISNTGQIVGEYSDGSGNHVFVYAPSTGDFTPINVPCGTISGGVSVDGINSRGDIVGNCNVGSGLYSGSEIGFDYNYLSGQFTPLYFPLSYTQSSFVTGVNDNGQVVGFFSAPEPGVLLILLINLASLVLIRFRSRLHRSF